MDTGTQIPLKMLAWFLLENAAGSHGNFIFTFVRNLPAIHSSRTKLHAHGGVHKFTFLHILSNTGLLSLCLYDYSPSRRCFWPVSPWRLAWGVGVWWAAFLFCTWPFVFAVGRCLFRSSVCSGMLPLTFFICLERLYNTICLFSYLLLICLCFKDLLFCVCMYKYYAYVYDYLLHAYLLTSETTRG